MDKIDEVLNGLTMELRRGAVILGVLSQLSGAQYGYSLVQTLEAKGFYILTSRAFYNYVPR